MGRFPASSWEKFWQAERHLQPLKPEIDRIFDPKRGAIRLEAQTDRQERTFFIVVEALPDLTNPALRIGDAIHNLRGSLDHLVWAAADPKVKRDANRARRISYPLATSLRAFESGKGASIPGVGAELEALIKRYQPYQRGDRGLGMRWLRILSNRDKHRLLVPFANFPVDAVFECDSQGCWIGALELLFKAGQPLKVGAKLARAPVRKHRGTAKAKVIVKSSLSTYPGFRTGRAVFDTIKAIQDSVGAFLVAAEKLL